MNILDDICRYVNNYSKFSIFFAIFMIYLPITNINIILTPRLWIGKRKWENGGRPARSPVRTA
jgi:hypothetical protein